MESQVQKTEIYQFYKQTQIILNLVVVLFANPSKYLGMILGTKLWYKEYVRIKIIEFDLKFR